MHGICITEKLSGTFNGVDLVSVRYMVGNTPTAIDNGSVVEVGALEANSREVCKATAPKKNSAKAAIALIASPEVIYDERLRNDLGNFENEANAVSRGYLLEKPHQIFAVTGEVLDGDTARIVGAAVELQDGTKLLAVATNTQGSTKIGEIIEVFTKKGKTYYAIETC
jgi:hypothetical protein